MVSISDDLLDLGTAKYELTYHLCVGPTMQIAPFLRNPWTSVSSMLEAKAERVRLRAAALCLGALPIQEGL